MDIGSKSGFPSGNLSNFTPHPFVIDGVECNSMEGFLQALKFENPNIQKEVCLLIGLQAKRRGSKRNKRWKTMQTLWWQGKAYPRKGQAYQELLDRAYTAIAKNTKFRKALLATNDAVLTHSMGRRDPSETVLTKTEFCSRLTILRKGMRDTLSTSK